MKLVLEWYLCALTGTSFLHYLVQNMKMEVRIEHTWDGLPVSHDPVAIALQSYDAGLLMQVSAPFFNDPPAPLGAPGKPFRKLWDYEGKRNFCCKHLLCGATDVPMQFPYLVFIEDSPVIF